MNIFFKKLFCFHPNWTNKIEYMPNFSYLLRNSKPWPHGTGHFELMCTECGKVKNFGWSNPELGYFATPNIPINFDYKTDYVSWR